MHSFKKYFLGNCHPPKHYWAMWYRKNSGQEQWSLPSGSLLSNWQTSQQTSHCWNYKCYLGNTGCDKGIWQAPKLNQWVRRHFFFKWSLSGSWPSLPGKDESIREKMVNGKTGEWEDMGFWQSEEFHCGWNTVGGFEREQRMGVTGRG